MHSDDIATTSTETRANVVAKDKEKEEEPRPFIEFTCGLCGLHEKSLFGELRCSDGFYPSPIFYMRDPFEPMIRIKGRKPVLADFLVIGSCCSMCQQPVCMSKACSIYFGAHFCATCVARERRRFPAEVLEQLSKAQPRPADGK